MRDNLQEVIVYVLYTIDLTLKSPSYFVQFWEISFSSTNTSLQPSRALWLVSTGTSHPDKEPQRKSLTAGHQTAVIRTPLSLFPLIVLWSSSSVDTSGTLVHKGKGTPSAEWPPNTEWALWWQPDCKKKECSHFQWTFKVLRPNTRQIYFSIFFIF